MKVPVFSHVLKNIMNFRIRIIIYLIVESVHLNAQHVKTQQNAKAVSVVMNYPKTQNVSVPVTRVLCPLIPFVRPVILSV